MTEITERQMDHLMWSNKHSLTPDFKSILRESFERKSELGVGYPDPEEGRHRPWSDTWHVSSSLFFCENRLACDACKVVVRRHGLMSGGTRYLSTEQCALPVTGYDRVCLDCVFSPNRDQGVADHQVYDGAPYSDVRIFKDKPLEDILKDKEVRSFRGFDKLSVTNRRKYVEASLGRALTEEEATTMLEPKKGNCEDWVCVLTGAFTVNMTHILEDKGARIVKAVTNAVTHCIVGKPAAGAFGGKSGPGSKKAKESRKKKKIILTEEEIVAVLVEKTKSMDDLMAERESAEKEKREKAKARAKERKRQAAEELASMTPRLTRRARQAQSNDN